MTPPKSARGQTDPLLLLTEMKPHLHDGEYVFLSVASSDVVPPDLPIATFRETEGLTLVLARTDADLLGLEYHFVARWITLTVHSALEAVGLTAAFSNALAQADISCNVMAGFYHDHIFVGADDAERAMEVLKQLSERV